MAATGPNSARFTGDRARAIHRHAWLWEPLEAEPTFVLRSMFGAKAAYLGGRLMLCFCARTEPWRGVLVATERSHHAALVAEFPELAPHPILSKWLYLPETADAFERVGERLVARVRHGDTRIGVVPQPKKRRKAPANRPGHSHRSHDARPR